MLQYDALNLEQRAREYAGLDPCRKIFQRKPGSVDCFRLLFSYTAAMSRYTKANHTVYLHFMSRQNGWHCQFLEADLKTSLPRTLTFASPDKIRELARRGEAWGDLESRQSLEHAIEMGRGGLYLKLTPEQYAQLKRG